MKKIIGGKLYNTKTATVVASITSGEGFSFREETLYVTKNNAYFLHGLGGPLTRWSRNVGQNSVEGFEDIITMSIQEVKTWLEDNQEIEAYEKLFGLEEA